MLFSNNDILYYGDTVVATEGYGVETYGHIRAMHEFGMDLLEIRKFETQCESAALEAYVAAGSRVTMESFEGELQIMREGFLKEWKDKIVAALKKAWAKIKGWFKSLKNWVKNLLTSDKKWFEENKSLISSSGSKTIKIDHYEYDVNCVKFEGLKNIGGMNTNMTEAITQEEADKKIIDQLEIKKNGSVADSVRDAVTKGGVKKIQNISVSKLVELKNDADGHYKDIDICERDVDNAYKLVIKGLEEIDKKEKDEKTKEMYQHNVSAFRMKQSAANTALKTYMSLLVEASKFATTNVRKAVNKKEEK